jgi:hypothetical protein
MGVQCSASCSSAREAISSFWYPCVRCISTVRIVTNSSCAISRLVRPSAAMRAIRSSLAVSASTPRRMLRRGRAPVALSSSRARSASARAPQRSARSSASRSGSRASARLPVRRRAAPSATNAFACSRRADESRSSTTASRRWSRPPSRSSVPTTRSDLPTVPARRTGVRTRALPPQARGLHHAGREGPAPRPSGSAMALPLG